MALTIVDIELEIRIHSKTMKTLDREIVHDFLDLKYVYFLSEFCQSSGEIAVPSDALGQISRSDSDHAFYHWRAQVFSK